MSSIRVSSMYGTIEVVPCSVVDCSNVTLIEGAEELPDFVVEDTTE